MRIRRKRNRCHEHTGTLHYMQRCCFCLKSPLRRRAGRYCLSAGCKLYEYMRGEKVERSQMEIKEEEGRVITSYQKHNSRAQGKTLNQVSPHPSVVISRPTMRLAKSERRDKDRDRIGYHTNLMRGAPCLCCNYTSFKVTRTMRPVARCASLAGQSPTA